MSVAKRSAGSLMKTMQLQATVLGSSLGAAWLTLALNVLSGGALLPYGIVPRSVTGLRGILFAPFLHANLAHLTANTGSFVVLGWLVMLRDKRHFGRVTLAAALTSGITSWLLGAPGSVHIGASGVIFGYLGFLMVSGWYARTFASIGLSIGVTAVWGSLVFGVLPNMPGVSWQGHLGGFIGGVLAARAFRRA
ncbi:MAG: rhomboid family intramembrane serine protease [Gemmatimonadaceae bacterium]|nr:rhomboid family intramembrane serine protease [Gemmatimonadaceae bacterium]